MSLSVLHTPFTIINCKYKKEELLEEYKYLGVTIDN